MPRQRKVLYIIVCSLLYMGLDTAVITVVAQAQETTPAVVDEQVAFRNRWALLIGVGQYAAGSGFEPLSYPAQDVRQWTTLLQRYGGFGHYPDSTLIGDGAAEEELPKVPSESAADSLIFKPNPQRSAENIITLVDSAATRQAIVTAFNTLKERVGPDDLVVIYFSGRALQVADDLYVDEADFLDECLLPYDAQVGNTRSYFLDDELGHSLRRLNAKHCAVILDADFSGTGRNERSPLGTAATIADGIDAADYLPGNHTVVQFGLKVPGETTGSGAFGLVQQEISKKRGRFYSLNDFFTMVIPVHWEGSVRKTEAGLNAAQIPLLGSFARIVADSLGTPVAAAVTLNELKLGLKTPLKIALVPGDNEVDAVLFASPQGPVVSSGQFPSTSVYVDTNTVNYVAEQSVLKHFIVGADERFLNLSFESQFLLLSVLVLVALGGGYKLAGRRQKRQKAVRLEAYPRWGQTLHTTLMASGTARLDFVPKKHRAYVSARYAAEHPEFELRETVMELVFNEASHTAFVALTEQWEHAAGQLEATHTEAFDPAAMGVIDQLSRSLGFMLEQPFRRFGHLWGVVVQAPTRSKLPASFPFIAIQRPGLQAEDIESLRNMMEVFGITSRFAILISFDQAFEARTLIKNSAQGLGYDFIVLDQAESMAIVVTRELERQRVFMRPILQQVDLALVSPYVTTGPAPENIFFGREVEIKTILQTLSSKSIGIVGGRRIGKTSILHKIQQTISQPSSDYRLFYANYQPVTNYHDFFAHMRSNWKLEAQRQEPERFYELISDLKRQTSESIVFLMDEVDALLRFDVDNNELLFKTFRALSEEGKCRFIFSGERILHAQLHDLASPLLNFCDVLPLRYLDAANAERIVTEPLALMDIELEDEPAMVRRILDISSCHPRIIQYICDRLVRLIAQDQVRRLQPVHFAEVIQSGEFQTEFIETIWGQGNPLERIITLVMALDEQQQTFSRAQLQQGLQQFNVPVVAADIDTALNNLHLCAVLETDREPFAFTAKGFSQILRQVKDIAQSIEQLKEEMLKTEGISLPVK